MCVCARERVNEPVTFFHNKMDSSDDEETVPVQQTTRRRIEPTSRVSRTTPEYVTVLMLKERSGWQLALWFLESVVALVVIVASIVHATGLWTDQWAWDAVYASGAYVREQAGQWWGRMYRLVLYG